VQSLLQSLALIDGQIAAFRARQAEDEAQYAGHKLGVLEDYQIFMAEVQRVSASASGSLVE
jgi:hypothetical protein